MKTQLKLTQKQTNKTLSFIGIMLFVLLALNPIYGQTGSTSTTEKTIKGLVSDEEGKLEGVNVFQKGTRNGTVTNEKGEFTFPVKLKKGDVLIFSYLGYANQKIVIKESTTFIKLVLTGDLVEMTGAPNSSKPYKSPRKN